MNAVTSYTARWILTAAGPPLERGILVIDGERIQSVEPHGTRRADVDLGNVALIPGLVNAHTHLDLTGAKGLIPPTDADHFTDWLKGVIAYRRTRSLDDVQCDIQRGLGEYLNAGTTLVCDIASGGASGDAIANAAIRGIVAWELIGLSPERFDAEWNRFTERLSKDTPHCRWWISPHAPYSVNRRKAVESMSRHDSVMHLAESDAETQLLTERKGPFVSFLKDVGVWNSDALGHRYAEYFEDTSQGAHHRLFVHGNHLPMDIRFPQRFSLCYCPRTHAAFGHPPHPFREFLNRGVRVCLGTDSLASNPDLDILEEARFIKRRYPDFDGETLLKMATLFGAEALGFADQCGSLVAGKSADAVAVPLPNAEGDPYDLLLLNGDHGQRQTLFRGARRPPVAK